MPGPSGTGKSVFLKCLIGLLRPEAGSMDELSPAAQAAIKDGLADQDRRHQKRSARAQTDGGASARPPTAA